MEQQKDPQDILNNEVSGNSGNEEVQKENNNAAGQEAQEVQLETDSEVKTDPEENANSEAKGDSGSNEELEALKAKLKEQSQKCDEYFSRMQRLAAEFDNYKKRTAKEKESLYLETVADVVAVFLPVADNLDRALKAAEDSSDQSLKEGVQLVHRQMMDVLKSLGVEEIKSVGEKFNPDLHNAVMHVTDDSVGEGIIVEEFQKGYIIKDKVVRYSMVKVAN
ncbi:nucleotide exchange factor GrpE [Clostridium thermosuccinogenes]|jgi:molecular chaperone GrpE|uniref:Protein GrpE n=1 Tax=Clostridium thermosuccinogenes TaxID=84032 RepID=A0A2K2FM00_9CLOT|nr:nucleotide exchange factor GrpE [Pseudoclostridium thermosuccinogenes]AUS95935.1 nucleotide exchange factor GrpE [Pseudoclostridium thermosuccinogenes]PNT93350.1 nucleotide exchange factor GrpE [Pseudoclostridium thermosuccinogenes]PNT97878.1 nucleotide exchange factor GrpE [Pseudoclostridium thermosuccinogenes]PNT99810.1 nucleotide exchange factor GrpE [Pseudoclostridium thermosuccinogenes]